jgi:predicted ferric reductase
MSKTLHILLLYTFLGLLWSHASLKSHFNLIGLITISAILTVQKVIYVGLIFFRNRSFRATNIATSDKAKHALCQLVSTLERPWKYQPGQYVYIRIPRLGLWRWYDRIESHPFQIAWYDNGDGDFIHSIHVPVEPQMGFSRRLETELSIEDIKVQLEGPYGDMQIVNYDKIILISNGIGIVSHLAAVKYLLSLGARTRTRRIDLIWYSQSKSQNLSHNRVASC